MMLLRDLTYFTIDLKHVEPINFTVLYNIDLYTIKYLFSLTHAIQ